MKIWSLVLLLLCQLSTVQQMTIRPQNVTAVTTAITTTSTVKPTAGSKLTFSQGAMIVGAIASVVTIVGGIVAVWKCCVHDVCGKPHIQHASHQPETDLQIQLLDVLAENLGDAGSNAEVLAENLGDAGSNAEVLAENLGDAGSNAEVLAENLGDAGSNAEVLTENLGDAGSNAKVLAENLGDAGSKAEALAENLDKLSTVIIKANLENQNPGLERTLSQQKDDDQEKDRKKLLYDIKTGLKSEYKERYGMILFIPWDEKEKVALEDIYIPLKLENNIDNPSSQNIEKVIENFSSDKPVRLIISANPGCGKSTLCRKVMYQWSEDGSFISEKYQLVLLLKAREFISQQNMLSAILNPIPKRFHRNKRDQIERIIENTKVLLLIDGFDELKVKDEQDDLHSLLDNKLYENCGVIITTRPWCLEKIQTLMKEVENQVVNISSFDDKDIKDYAKKFFERKQNPNENVIEEFCREVNNGYVKDLAREPLTLLFLCLIYEHRQSLPKIRTHLYERLHDVLLIRYNKTQKYRGGCEISKPDWDSLLLLLGKLAFDKLIAEEGGILVFNEQDLDQYGLASDTVFAAGLLTKADPPQEEPDSNSLPSVYSEKFFMFAHLSIQECLAARYFYNTFDNVASDKNLKTLQNLKTRQQQTGHLYNFTRFVCGYVSLDKEVNDEKLNMLNMLIGAMITPIAYSTEKPFWEETGRNPLYKWVSVDNDCITDYYHYYSNVSDGNNKFCVERAQCLDISEWDGNELDKNSKFNCEHGFCLSAICNALKDTRTLETVSLEHLKCDCENRADELLGLIKNNKNIEGLCIQDCDITSDIAKSSDLELLTDLDLSENSLKHRVCDIIKKLPNTIKNINLHRCGITAEHATSLSQSFSKFTKLEDLDLSDNHIGKGAEAIIANLNKSVCDLNIDGGAVAVVEHLSDSIQDVSMTILMKNCGITQTVAEGMAPHLAKLKALVWLDLSHNPIGGGAVTVVKHLSDSIRHLLMGNCEITPKTAGDMAPYLTKLKALKWLDLSHNPIGTGAEEVVANLCDSNKFFKIEMNDCGITAEHVRNMVTHLNSSKLEDFFLYLTDNGISEDDQKELGQMTKSTYYIHFVS